jgi:hypothetical protein
MNNSLYSHFICMIIVNSISFMVCSFYTCIYVGYWSALCFVDSEVLTCSPSKRSSTHPHVEPDVDHLFQLGVNVMYHEDMYFVVQYILKTYGSAWKILSPTRLSMYSEHSLPYVG